MSFLKEVQEVTRIGKKKEEERRLKRREALIRWAKEEIMKAAEEGKNKVHLSDSEEGIIILFDFLFEEGFEVRKCSPRMMVVIW